MPEKNKDDDSNISTIDLTSIPEKDRASTLKFFYSTKFIVALVIIIFLSTGLLLDKISGEIFITAIVAVAGIFMIGKK